MIYRNGELYLSGAVGSYPGEEHFTATMVREGLSAHRGGALTVILNSGGGYVADAFPIFNGLKAVSGHVTVVVDGIAASAGSLIAMAGDTIHMRRGALMMIHCPAGGGHGTAADHERDRLGLERMEADMAAIYAARSGQDIVSVRRMMAEETWFTGDEAVAAGFADAVEDHMANAVAQFDYAKAYRRAPQHLRDQEAGTILRQAAARANWRRNGMVGADPATKPRTALSGVMDEVLARRGMMSGR